jgi:uncharacterized metal-binding protein YceD (DUF177 family)
VESPLRIFIDRLREQGKQDITCILGPDFVGVSEAQLEFVDPVAVSGEAYLADDYMVLHGRASTQARVPCNICNEWVTIPVEADEIYQAEPLSEAVKGVIDFGPTVRDALLLEVPQFVECGEGHCPQREVIDHLLHKESDQSASNPFQNL